MKKLFLSLIFSLLVTGISAQKIEWMTMDEALEAQKEEPRKIFMDAYTVWCGPCKMLDRNTFSNKKLAQFVNENFYPVKFNAEGNEVINYRDMTFSNPSFQEGKKGRNSQHQFAAAMRITGYPSLAFFDEKGELFQVLTGYRNPKQLEFFLKAFATDDYKEFESEEDWVEYEKEFRYTFK